MSPRESRWRWRQGLGLLAIVVVLAGTWVVLSSVPRTGAMLASLEGFSGDLTFGVVGDSGTGNDEEWAVAGRMEEVHGKVRYPLVLMLGDNIYPDRCGDRPFVTCFEEPFEPLLSAGVRFYAVVGNHDEAEAQVDYAPFSMPGKPYYTFTAGPDGLAQFFAIVSDEKDDAQLEWLEGALAESRAVWKIAFFHKPIYNAGRHHGPDLPLRSVLEPLFVKYGVNVALSGHEHVYERLRPQNGVHYFISGAAGHVNRGLNRSDPILAAGNDRVCSFMIFALTPRELRFESITMLGRVLDSGSIPADREPVSGAGGR